MFATDHYWVGNSGNWTDAAHWSFISGGVGGAGVPGAADNAIFDQNSFTRLTAEVTISADAHCNNMDWSKAKNWPILKGGSTAKINVYGSLRFKRQFQNNFKGDIYFRSNQQGNRIRSTHQEYKGDIYFDGEVEREEIPLEIRSELVVGLVVFFSAGFLIGFIIAYRIGRGKREIVPEKKKPVKRKKRIVKKARRTQ